MSNKIYTQLTNLVCLDCGNIMMIQRKKSNLKKIGHIKDLYCINCKKNTKHFEVKEINKFLWIYNYLDDSTLNDNTLKVLNYLRKSVESYENKRFGVYKKVLTKK